MNAANEEKLEFIKNINATKILCMRTHFTPYLRMLEVNINFIMEILAEDESFQLLSKDEKFFKEYIKTFTQLASWFDDVAKAMQNEIDDNRQKKQENPE